MMDDDDNDDVDCSGDDDDSVWYCDDCSGDDGFDNSEESGCGDSEDVDDNVCCRGYKRNSMWWLYHNHGITTSCKWAHAFTDASEGRRIQ